MPIQTEGSTSSIDSGSVTMPGQDQPTASFLPGQIISLSVYEFMSLENDTFTFGPEINILHGPRASDMQSVLLAIYVGLGGRYSDSQLDNMIKVNSSQFRIQITLKRSDNEKDLVVQRTHQLTEPYTPWMIDETPANIDKVTKDLAALKINVECKLDWMLTTQFEEVYEQICSPQELLMLTEKTVSKPDIVALHKKLVKLEDERADVSRQVYRIKHQIKKRRNAKVDTPDNSKVMNNRKASLAHAESALRGMQSELKQIEEEIDNKTTLWRKGTRRMAENLPHSFRSSLVYLSHDGKMKLVTSGGSANWGLEIYIQNKSSAEDQLLTHQSHSEDDRFIAMTAVMMTLHRSSTSPIRFFDAINLSQEWKQYIRKWLAIEVTRHKKVQLFISSSSFDPKDVVPSSTV